MPRLLFEKKGDAQWISHLDLMRLFQRSFKRAGLPLTHTQGFNPRPSVSIALPLSVGIESDCELLDFDLDGAPVPLKEIQDRLNDALIPGVRVMEVYDNGNKIKNLTYLDCTVDLEYDAGVPQGAVSEIEALFRREELLLEKKSKNGIQEQNIIPMIRQLRIETADANTVCIHGMICCQNPSLNPMQLAVAVATYLPEMEPDFYRCRRNEIYDEKGNVFR